MSVKRENIDLSGVRWRSALYNPRSFAGILPKVSSC